MKFLVTFTSLYLTIIPLVVFPYVKKTFSSDFFDLFSLIFVIQSLIMILEFGFTNILIKLTGDARKELIGTSTLFVFSFALFFYVVAAGAALTAAVLANHIFGFVNFSHVKLEILICLIFIGCSRFLSSIPRIVLYGYEIFLQPSLVTVLMAPARFLIPLGLLHHNYIDQPLFFVLYLIISLLETFVLSMFLHKKLGFVQLGNTARDQLRELSFVAKRYWRTATYTFIPSLMWLLSSQGDKAFYLSGEGLAGAGMIVAISGLASGVLLVVNAVNAAFIPRLVSVDVGSNDYNMNWRQMIGLGAIILVASCSIGFFLSKQVLTVWFQDAEIGLQYFNFLRLYLLYFSLLAGGSYFYVYFFLNDILQYHLISNIIFSIMVFCIWLSASSLTQYLWLMCVNSVFCSLVSGIFLARHRSGLKR